MKEETIDIGTVGDDLLRAYEQGLEDGKPKWISVTERLPMRNTKVLLAYKQGVTLGYLGAYPKEGEKAYFHGIHGWKHTLSSVTHWQYLPEPPKDGGT